jgi:DNA-binding SARP family transcriptional activator
LGESDVRIQLCGPLVIERDGRRLEGDLPGAQGRWLFAFLALRHPAPARRDELVDALWPDGAPAAADAALRALLSKSRRALGADLLPPGGDPRLALPPGARVDLDAARDAIHRAESALALGEWHRAWGAAQVTLFAARRGFCADGEAPWLTAVRRELDALYDRALEAYALASLRVGGTELPTSERAARELVARAPYRESAHRYLMEALAQQGNVAEAIRVYEHVRALLRDELGIAPCAETRALHAQLLS